MCISDLSGCNLIGLASSLAILLAQDLSPDEIGILAAFFTALGDNLAILSVSPMHSDKDNTSNSSTQNDTNCSQ